jgi:hypothetical protein
MMDGTHLQIQSGIFLQGWIFEKVKQNTIGQFLYKSTLMEDLRTLIDKQLKCWHSWTRHYTVLSAIPKGM